METAHTSQENPAEIAALFAYLDAPAEKVAPVAPAAEAVKPAKQTGKVLYAELKSKTSKIHGHVYEGQVEKGFQAEIIPGQSVRIFGTQYNRINPKAFDLTFEIGALAEYDSFNLIYVGTITKIGPKTVTITETGYDGRSHQLDICSFARKNWDFDYERISKQNSEWRD